LLVITKKAHPIPNDPAILNALIAIFNVTLDYLLLDKESADSNKIESKLHRQIKKLTDETNNKLIKWEALSDCDNNGEEFGFVDTFIKNLPQYKTNSPELDPNHSYIYWRQGGAYLIIKTLLSDENLNHQFFDVALLIEYNENLHYMANTKNIQTLDDLYLAVTNTAAGLDEFIDAYLNDDWKRDDSEILF